MSGNRESSRLEPSRTSRMPVSIEHLMRVLLLNLGVDSMEAANKSDPHKKVALAGAADADSLKRQLADTQSRTGFDPG
jgi:hypothetical protein